jgi:hypothetical protein
MNLLKWGVRSIDYFGQPVQITFDRQRKYNTIFGGLLSLGMYTFIFILIVKAAYDLLNKTQPKTSLTSLALTDSPLLNLKNNNMIYSALILDRNFVPVNDPSYFTIEIFKFEVIRKNGSEQYNYINMPKYDCNKYYDHFKSEGFEEDFKSKQLSLGTCFDVNSSEVIIGGNFIKEYFSNILFRVQKCKNGTDTNVVCKPENKIIDKLQGAFFQFYYIDKNIELNDFQTPFKKYFSRYFILLDPMACKFVDIYFKTVNITTDAGIVFEESQNNKYDILFDYFREQIDTSATDGKVIDFLVNSSNNVDNYNRSYQKFQDYAATIGGLMKVMTFFGAIFSTVFNNYEMNVLMFSSLFHFKKDRKGEIKLEDKKTSLKNFNKMMKDYSIEQQHNSKVIFNNNITIDAKFDNTSKQINTVSNNYVKPLGDCAINNLTIVENKRELFNLKIKGYRKSFIKEVKLNTLSYLEMYLCCVCSKREKSNVKLYKYACEKLIRYLDYLEIIKTLQQFHKIKKIIFNKTQERLFSFYQRPVISLEKVTKEEEKRLKRSTEDDEYFSLYEAYLKAKAKGNKHKYYKKLIDNVDEEIINVFNNV